MTILRRSSGGLCGAVVTMALFPGPAPALTLPAACSGTTGDVSSLINQINVANVNAGPDTVELGSGCRYTIDFTNNAWYGPNGLPAISSEVTIEGNGATIAKGEFARLRFFFVGADPTSARTPNYVTPGPGRLTLRDVTLEGGLARGGGANRGGGGAGMGGAIFNQGTVVLERTTLTANTAEGGSAVAANGGRGGGGIGASSDSTGEQFGGGFGSPFTAVPSAGVGGSGGSGVGGGGGAGFRLASNGQNGSADGFGNRIGGDGGGSGSGLGGARGGSPNGAGGFGGDGSGGGGGGPTTAAGTGGAGGGFGFGGKAGTSLLGYGGGGGVGGGGGGGANGIVVDPPGAGGGAGGFGGGGGAVGNATVLNGSGGDGGFGGGGAGGCSGCLAGSGGFGGGNGTTDAGGGGAGMGGAIFNMQGELTIRNSTLAANTAIGGTGGASNPGQGLGGAVFNLNGTVAADGSTFAANTAAEGGDSLYNLVYDSATNREAATTLRDTIVADEGGSPDLVTDMPIFTSFGFNSGSAIADVAAFNLVRTMEVRTAATPITGTPLTADPLLGPLSQTAGRPKRWHRPRAARSSTPARRSG